MQTSTQTKATNEQFRLFEKFDPKTIENSANTIYGLDRELRIVVVNPAYYRFADENNGPEIANAFGPGSSLMSAISGPLHDFYEQFFRRAFDSDEPTQHDYECSSPELFRKYRLVAYPNSERNALLIEHALIVEKPHSASTTEDPADEYIDEHGIMHQCGHCRRLRRNDDARWDWVPASLEFKNVSHGLCSSCMGHYYPDLVD